VTHKQLYILTHPLLKATGSSIGYLYTGALVDSGMRQLREQRIALNKDSPASRERETTALDLRAGNQQQFEGGSAGMYDFSDRGHTTRGDH
jgi:hypothetical protein